MAIYLPLTDEQQFLVEAAEGALARVPALEQTREALDGAALPSRWELAVGVGWPGLLSAEAVDGAELSPGEAVLVLRACGRALVDAHLLGHLPATLLLEAAGADEVLRRDVASGARRAALVDGELTAAGTALEGRRSGDVLEVSGTATGVLDAAGADVLVVVTRDGVGVAEQVAVEPESSYDASRALGTVVLDGLQLSALDAPEPHQGRDLQRLLLAAESLGAAEACLEMARTYAIDRQAFGRAIGSYQALKHKLVEMLRRTENAVSLVMAATATADPAERSALSNAALVAAESALTYAAPENIFIHGGVGATWEHDASLYYRRAEVSRRLAGGAEAAAVTVAETLLSTPSAVSVEEAGGLQAVGSAVAPA